MVRHILVPTDFSESAAAALAHAAELASLTGARLTVLNVIFTEKITEDLLGLDALEYLTRSLDSPAGVGPYSTNEWIDRLRQSSLEKLDEAVATLPDPKPTIETVVAEGRPAVAVLDYAAEHGVDLIVMGTHGRGAIGRAFLGSVADNVVRQAECPVTVIRK